MSSARLFRTVDYDEPRIVFEQETRIMSQFNKSVDYVT